MKIHELRAMNDAELTNELEDLYQEQMNLRFQKASGKLTNTARLGVVRKQMARIKTILRERELMEMAF